MRKYSWIESGRDLAALTAVASIGVGLWTIYPPLVWLWAGGVLLCAFYFTRGS